MSFFNSASRTAASNLAKCAASLPVSSAGILTEDISQAVHHFLEAARDGDTAAICNAVLFINGTLTENSARYRRSCNSTEAIKEIQRNRISSSSLQQWVEALECLSTAAMPAALEYLYHLYDAVASWRQDDRQCALLLLNLVFFIIVLHRQLGTDVEDLRRRAAPVGATPAGLDPFLFPASEASKVANADSAILEAIEGRLLRIGQFQRSMSSRYFIFIAFNAEVQLGTIGARAAVRIKGLPLLSELPLTAVYLSEYDGWVWLLTVVLLHSMMAVRRMPGAVAPVPDVHSPSRRDHLRSHRPLSSFASGPHGLDSVSSIAALPVAEGSASYPFSSSRMNASGPAGPSTDHHHGAVHRTVLTRLLKQLASDGGGEKEDDGGTPFVYKLCSVVLSALDLFVLLWIRSKPILSGVLQAWSTRLERFERSDGGGWTNGQVAKLRGELQRCSLADVARCMVVLDDVVLHNSDLFFQNNRLFIQLQQLLEQSVPLQLFLLLVSPLCLSKWTVGGGVEDAAEMIGRRSSTTSSISSVSARRQKWTEEEMIVKDRDGCFSVILKLATATSHLLAHTAELLLEPRAQYMGHPERPALPQSLCIAMLKTIMLFIASESVLSGDFWLQTGVKDTSGGALRRQWRWWSIWMNTAHFICINGSQGGAQIETDDMRLEQRRGRDIFFTQALAVALEHLYSLVVMVGRPTEWRYIRVELCRIFSRLRIFFERLHEEHLTAIRLHVVCSFSALSEEGFNGFAQLLHHYAEATSPLTPPLEETKDELKCFKSWYQSVPNPTEAAVNLPPHRPLWLLAVAYLRLAEIDVASRLVASRRGQPSGQHILGSHSFACATPQRSEARLRDRSYETVEDWMQLPLEARRRLATTGNSAEDTAAPPQRWSDGALFFRCYIGEVQRQEEAVRELLLLSSVRFLNAAVLAASQAAQGEEVEDWQTPIASSASWWPSGMNSASESTASLYVTAFSRYATMMKSLASPTFLFLIRSLRDELRRSRNGGSAALLSNPVAATVSPALETAVLDECDLQNARAFELAALLYAV